MTKLLLIWPPLRNWISVSSGDKWVTHHFRLTLHPRNIPAYHTSFKGGEIWHTERPTDSRKWVYSRFVKIILRYFLVGFVKSYTVLVSIGWFMFGGKFARGFVIFGYKCFVQSPERYSRCIIWQIYIDERDSQIKMAEYEITWPTQPPNFIEIGSQIIATCFCYWYVNCFGVVSVLHCLGGSSGSVSEGRVHMLHWLFLFHSTSSCRLDIDLHVGLLESARRLFHKGFRSIVYRFGHVGVYSSTLYIGFLQFGCKFWHFWIWSFANGISFVQYLIDN